MLMAGIHDGGDIYPQFPLKLKSSSQVSVIWLSLYLFFMFLSSCTQEKSQKNRRMVKQC